MPSFLSRMSRQQHGPCSEAQARHLSRVIHRLQVEKQMLEEQWQASCDRWKDKLGRAASEAAVYKQEHDQVAAELDQPESSLGPAQVIRRLK